MTDPSRLWLEVNSASRWAIGQNRGDFREGPHDRLGLYPAAACRAAHGAPIELMIDGERAAARGEVAFTLSKLDVTLLGSGHG